MNKLIIYLMVLLIISSYAVYAAPTKEDIDGYKNDIKITLGRATSAEQDPQVAADTVETIYLLNKARIFQDYAKEKGIPVESTKAENDKFANILKIRIIRQKLDVMPSAEFNKLVNEFKTELIAQLKDQKRNEEAKEYEDKELILNRNIYNQPIFYAKKINYGLAGGIIGGVLALVAIILVLIKFRGKARNLFGKAKGTAFDVFSKGSSEVAEEIKRLKTFDDAMKLKKKLIDMNQEKLKEFEKLVRTEANKTEPALIVTQPVKDKAKEWKETVADNLVQLNKRIEENFKDQLDALKTMDRIFEREFNNALRNDLKIIHKLVTYTPKQFDETLNEVKNILGEELEIVKDVHPKITELIHALRVLKGKLRIEENLTEQEKIILTGIVNERLVGEQRKTSLDILLSSAKRKNEAFNEEQETITKIGQIKKELERIESESIAAESKIKQSIKFSSAMFRQPKKYFRYVPTEMPLSLKTILKGYTEITKKKISSIGELLNTLRDEDLMNDVTAYLLFRKRKNNKSDLYNWLDSQYGSILNGLSKEVEDAIDEFKLQENLKNVIAFQIIDKQEVAHITDPETENAVHALRTRIKKIILKRMPQAYTGEMAEE